MIVRWGAQGSLQVSLFSEGLSMVPLSVISAGTPLKCQGLAWGTAQKELACRCPAGLSAMLTVLSRC